MIRPLGRIPSGAGLRPDYRNLLPQQRSHVIVTELIGGATARLASSSTVPIIVTVTEDLNPQPPYAAATLLKPFPLPALLDDVRRALRAKM